MMKHTAQIDQDETFDAVHEKAVPQPLVLPTLL